MFNDLFTIINKQETLSSFIEIKTEPINKRIGYKIDIDQIQNGIIEVNKILDNQML